MVDYHTENGKLIFISFSSVPEGFTITKAGVIITRDSAVGTSGDGFNDKTAQYTIGNPWSGTAYRYTLTLGNQQAGVVWYARAYLVYTDANGNSHTVYGDVVSQSL